MSHWRQWRRKILLCKNNLSRFVGNGNHINFKMKWTVGCEGSMWLSSSLIWLKTMIKQTQRPISMTACTCQIYVGWCRTKCLHPKHKVNISNHWWSWRGEAMSAEEHKELNDAFHFNVNMTSLKTNCSENNLSLGFIYLKKSEKSSNNLDEHMLQVFGLTCHLETNAFLCLECNCSCDCTCFCKQDKQIAQSVVAVKCLKGKHCALWLHFCAAFELILRLTSVM